MTRGAGRVADSTGNWVDGVAPAWARPYLRLARLDRPIGSWLLLMPCWWSVGLAAVHARSQVNVWHLLLFFIGAFAMRGAGCTWNDIVDRDLDAKVERTRSRPIPSGQASVAAAAAFLGLQALVGLAVLGDVIPVGEELLTGRGRRLRRAECPSRHARHPGRRGHARPWGHAGRAGHTRHTSKLRRRRPKRHDGEYQRQRKSPAERHDGDPPAARFDPSILRPRLLTAL